MYVALFLLRTGQYYLSEKLLASLMPGIHRSLRRYILRYGQLNLIILWLWSRSKASHI